MSYGVHEVSFTQTGFTVEKQRIIRRCGTLCNGKGCGIGEFIVGAYDESAEIISRIEAEFIICRIFYSRLFLAVFSVF